MKNLHNKKKRFITLIELLISMTLTTLVLSILFYFYRDLDWINQDMEKSQKEAFRLSYVQNRFADVLPNIVSPRTAEKDFFFYTSTDANGLLKGGSPSLVFTYNFGSNRDPAFANHVLGRLYLDSDNQLSLATWPSPPRWSNETALEMKKELLLDKVESITFRFYVPPKRNRSAVLGNAPKGQTARGNLQPAELEYDHWYTEWKNEYNQLPAIVEIKLKIKDREEPILFSYPLPKSDFVITYEK